MNKLAYQKYKKNEQIMSHNKLLDRDPSVIFTTSNKNELKVYQGNQIYLNHGDNFELRFFNPLQEKIGVEIVFNGIKKGDSYLILNPGQDVFLDRFLDEQRKMLFETYSIDAENKDAVEAIAKNGLITFNFYRESWKNNVKTEVDVKYEFPPKPYEYNYISTTNNPTTFNGIYNGTYNGSITLSGSSTTNSTVTLDGLFSSSNLMNCNSRTYTYTSNFSDNTIGLSGLNGESGSIGTTSLNINSIETGRIEKGETSTQKLKNVNVNFSDTSFHTISYKLMPYSAKAQSINEIREYCTECGYRLRKSSWKFCPKCGEKII